MPLLQTLRRLLDASPTRANEAPAPAPHTPDETRARWAASLATCPDALTIEHLSGGRELVFEIAPDAGITIRRFGGPIYQMGAVWNAPLAEVEQWQAPPDAALRARLLGALAEAGFPHPHHPEDMPLPGEPLSSVTLRLGDEVAMMHLLHRTTARYPALAEALGALDHAGYLATQRPADARVPNPELSLWPAR